MTRFSLGRFEYDAVRSGMDLLPTLSCLLDYSSYLGEVRVSLIFSLDKLKDLTLDFSRHFCFGQVKTVFPLKSARN